MPRMPAPAVPVAIAQFAPSADSEANARQIDRMVDVAADRGASLVVFPEYSSYFVDPFDQTLARHAQPVDGPFIAALQQSAQRTGTVVVAGLIETATNPAKVRNAVVAVGSEGVLAVYRKLHLYDAFGQRESDWVEAGELVPPQTFDVGGLRWGLMTCYDLRFPEVARTLVDAGAEGMVVPAAWVRGPLKEFQWQTLLAARAIENTVFVAAADHPPPLGVGASVVLDPQGVAIAGVGTGTDVAVGYVDPDVIDRVRRVNPALRLRRFDVIPRP